MLKNDRVNMIIALIIAIALWAYVIGGENPSITKTIRNIPIKFLNADALAEEGLVLLSTSDETVSVSISGQRKDTKGIEVADIKVTADLEGLSEGEHTIALKVIGPETVDISEASKRKIVVKIDQLITEEKPVETSFYGALSDESEPYIVQVTPEKMQVTGAKSLVDSVVKISAVLDTDRVQDSMRALNVTPVPVDKNGNVVEGVKLSENNVSVTAVLLNKKTVTLDVPIIGQDAGDAERTVTIPKSITIKGTAETLVGITSITAETINLSDVYEDSKIKIVPLLPEGVEVAANSKNLAVQVVVSGIERKTFEYSLDSIVIEGVTEEMIATLEEVEIHLVVAGKEEIIEGISAEDFYFSIDVEDLKPGTHTVLLKCVHDKKNLSEISFDPTEVTVTLEKKPVQDDNGHDADEEESPNESEEGEA
ncbi:MAG: hypothetical protein HFE73_03925 [Firmicutes bacterium]|nr:hypothetical protein [Bacillota bacterium]